MSRDRSIQFIAAFLFVLAMTGAGFMMPSLMADQDEYELKYTEVSVEGAPPFVALSTGIGALRGIFVNYLWIKITVMKERGQFYEIMADADLLTKLQPRFGKVWTFHGHNMAYNVSVATHTQEERWEWVRAGLRLVQNEGLRYNPNDLELYRELAWWYQHKVDGYSDDAHLFYKHQFCREWHELLGPPPSTHEGRIAWWNPIATAPDSLDEVIEMIPEVQSILDRLAGDMGEFERKTEFKLDSEFLREYGRWQDVTKFSPMAQALGVADMERQTNPRFKAFDAIASDPTLQRQWTALIAFVRKRVLLDEYNMKPEIMQRYTRDLGSLDWRHPQAHALYWSTLGMERGEYRAWNDDKIYRVLNNDRMQIHSMQALARTGAIFYDPFSNELPSRFPDVSWIDTIDQMFDKLYEKHYDTRGAGGETFIALLENFMSSAIREAYRRGDIERAESIMSRMDSRFGTGAGRPDNKYNVDLDVFVKNETHDQYQNQPYLAVSEVASAFRRGYRLGIGRDNEKEWEDAEKFSDQVINYFRDSEGNYGHVNKFGRGRLSEMVGYFETTRRDSFMQTILDTTIPMAERATIWQKVDKYNNKLRGEVYDRVIGQLQSQYQAHPFSQLYAFDNLFPAPPNLEAARLALTQEEARRQQRLRAFREGRGSIVPDQ